jgi:hypothetical protein
MRKWWHTRLRCDRIPFVKPKKLWQPPGTKPGGPIQGQPAATCHIRQSELLCPLAFNLFPAFGVYSLGVRAFTDQNI